MERHYDGDPFDKWKDSEIHGNINSANKSLHFDGLYMWACRREARKIVRLLRVKIAAAQARILRTM